MRCDEIIARYSVILGREFQSLSGFLMRCDPLTLIRSLLLIRFQSLSGFLMRCDFRFQV